MLSNKVWNFYSNLDIWLNVRFNSRCISSHPHQYTHIHIYRYHLYYINIYSGKERKMNVLLIEFEVNLVYKIAKDCFSISKILSRTLFLTWIFQFPLSANCLKHNHNLSDSMQNILDYQVKVIFLIWLVLPFVIIIILIVP